MRSRLEATVAEWLDAQGLVWKYEGAAYGTRLSHYAAAEAQALCTAVICSRVG
jgi:hypothetical protein